MRPRPVGADRAVVDDAAAARFLRLHHAHRLLGAQEGAGEIDTHDRLPLREGQILDRHGGRAHAGIVEQHVQAAELVLDLGEHGLHLVGVADIGGRHQMRALQAGGGLFQGLALASHQHGRPAGLGQPFGDGPSHAAAGARDHCNFCHVVFPGSRRAKIPFRS